jgi:hypothetical protein
MDVCGHCGSIHSLSDRDLFVPESPRWLATKGRSQQAFQVLSRLGGAAYAMEVLDELSSLDQAPGNVAPKRELLSPRVLKVIVLGCALAILQQWCGINVIFNYAQEIFAAAGYQISDILFNIVVTGAVNAAASYLTIADSNSRVGMCTVTYTASEKRA